uniref:Uncharacterized protein n=1 Tax=Steinernema glaseri TaxID=37863 RepID=A0A1I7Y935_9BILA
MTTTTYGTGPEPKTPVGQVLHRPIREFETTIVQRPERYRVVSPEPMQRLPDGPIVTERVTSPVSRQWRNKDESGTRPADRGYPLGRSVSSVRSRRTAQRTVSSPPAARTQSRTWRSWLPQRKAEDATVSSATATHEPPKKNAPKVSSQKPQKPERKFSFLKDKSRALNSVSPVSCRLTSHRTVTSPAPVAIAIGGAAVGGAIVSGLLTWGLLKDSDVMNAIEQICSGKEELCLANLNLPNKASGDRQKRQVLLPVDIRLLFKELARMTVRAALAEILAELEELERNEFEPTRPPVLEYDVSHAPSISQRELSHQSLATPPPQRPQKPHKPERKWVLREQSPPLLKPKSYEEDPHDAFLRAQAQVDLKPKQQFRPHVADVDPISRPSASLSGVALEMARAEERRAMRQQREATGQKEAEQRSADRVALAALLGLSSEQVHDNFEAAQRAADRLAVDVVYGEGRFFCPQSELERRLGPQFPQLPKSSRDDIILRLELALQKNRQRLSNQIYYQLKELNKEEK